jgi:hypothetical protein
MSEAICPTNKKECHQKECQNGVCQVTGYVNNLFRLSKLNEDLKPSKSEKLTAKQETPMDLKEVNHLLSIPLEEENVAKYGPKDDDTIARAYRHSKESGDVYCGFTAQKYITRFISKSKKANNNTDLIKAIDYLQRMMLMNQVKPEVIEK